MAMGVAYYQLQRANQPSFFNSLFTSTLNMATKMLVSFTSPTSTYFSSFNSHSLSTSTTTTGKLKQHLRFMMLLVTWFAVWAFRLASDLFPSLSPLASKIKLPASAASSYIFKPLVRLRPRVRGVTSSHRRDTVKRRSTVNPVSDGDDGNHHEDGGVTCTSNSALAEYSGGYSNSSPAHQNLDLIAHDGFLMEMDGSDDRVHDGQSVPALSRALSHVLSLLNELPSTSKKYEFAMAMADRILDENTRDNRAELLHINRVALSTAFESTSTLLHNKLIKAAISQEENQATTSSTPWATRLIKKLPLGSYINAYMKGGLTALLPKLGSDWEDLQKRRAILISGGGGGSMNNGEFGFGFESFGDDHSVEVVGAEKLAQELVWIIKKLRASRAVDEALVQWSHASGLASLSLGCNPRVQALLIKISASLLEDIARAEYQVPSEVQYRMLVLWLPLFCYASTGLRYPVLSSHEKVEVERTVDKMIGTLPAIEQEIVLRNWLQDFAICSSNWPDLRPAYERWCHSARQLA